MDTVGGFLALAKFRSCLVVRVRVKINFYYYDDYYYYFI